MSKPEPKRFFWVVCSDYAAGPFKSAERAETVLEETIALGACSLAHRVVETRTSRRPRTSIFRY